MDDRHFAELVLPPMLVLDAVIVGVDRSAVPEEFDRLAGLLQAAILQPVEQLPKAYQGKILRRANRLCTDVVAPYAISDLLGLFVFCLLRSITDAGTIEIGQATPMWQACELFLSAIEDLAQDDALMHAAEAGAAATLSWLRERGYFRIEIEVAL